MVKLKLDPRLLIGNLDSFTPFCVVTFVATLCGKKVKKEYWGNLKYMNELIDIIDSFNFPEIETPIKSRDSNLSDCIFFLNPLPVEKAWEFNSILDGINQVQDFLSKETKFENLELIFGYKTNIFPRKINELLCYNLCKHYGYITNINTTFDEMIFAVLKLSKEKEFPLLRRSVIENMKHLSSVKIVKYAYDMISIDTSTEYEIADDSQILIPSETSVDLKNITRTYTLLSNSTFLQQRVMPTDSNEAIILAMNRFNICIADSRSPVKQFKYLVAKKFNTRNIHEYLPIDDYNFCINYARNPKWYFINLNWFHELLPIYNPVQLNEFCKREGFFDSKINPDPKVLITYLRSKRSSTWIYFGIVPYCSKTVTFGHLTPIDEIEPENLICIGNISIGNLEYYSIEEFTDYLNSVKMLIDPIDKEPFCQTFVNKLKTYVKSMALKSTINRHIYTNMSECIENLEHIKMLIDYKVRELTILISESDLIIKQEVNTFFEKCIDMAFYMRGWTINGRKELPLKSGDTYYESGDRANNINSEEQNIVELNTCYAHVDLIKIHNKLPKNIADGISSLHLIRFSRIGETKEIFGMKINGMAVCQTLTLMECMYNSVYGDKDSEDNCIRSNSNWILFTAAWYSYIFGFNLRFRFDKIDEIS